MATVYTNSCAPINYPCPVGEKYIDPCTCRQWLECETGGYSVVERQCGPGTAWNHVSKGCDVENRIFIANGTPLCRQAEPWSRCKNVQNHYSEAYLKRLCDTSSEDSGGGGGSGSDDTGAIVGGVIGGLLVVALVAIAFLWWKKRQGSKSKSSNLRFRPSVQHQTKEAEDEEVYDVIDEKSVVPVISNVSYDKGIEYDNPALTSDNSEKGNDYSNLKQDPRPLQQHHHHHHHQQQLKMKLEQNQGRLTGINTPSNTGRGHTMGSGFTSATLQAPGSHSHELQNRSDVSSDDLSRSISVGGRDIVVEDSEGYHVGYPSGSVPRQPSPLPLPDDDNCDEWAVHGADPDYGYDLGKVPLPNDYYQLEKTDM